MKKISTRGKPTLCSTLLVIAIPAALTLGCAKNAHRHPSDHPQPTETFSTEITADGTKLFSYRVEMPERPRMMSGERQRRPGMEKRDRRAESGTPGRERSTKRLHERLGQKIAETAFCEEGYVVLDEVTGDRYASIRGECREGADEQENSTAS